MSLLDPAFTAWGVATSWLELIAVLLGFVCVVLNVLENHWGWPFAIVSCALFTWLFVNSRLYGDAGVQVFFVCASIWGWRQWLAGTRKTVAGAGPAGAGSAADNHVVRDPRLAVDPPARLSITALGWPRNAYVVLTWLALWPLIGVLLDTVTDSDVPYFDAFPTAGSVIGQYLLGRKYLENWAVWLLVNLASIALLGYKALYLSAALYAVFVVVAMIGWWRWRLQLRPPPAR